MRQCCVKKKQKKNRQLPLTCVCLLQDAGCVWCTNNCVSAVPYIPINTTFELLCVQFPPPEWLRLTPPWVKTPRFCRVCAVTTGSYFSPSPSGNFDWYPLIPITHRREPGFHYENSLRVSMCVDLSVSFTQHYCSIQTNVWDGSTKQQDSLSLVLTGVSTGWQRVRLVVEIHGSQLSKKH